MKLLDPYIVENAVREMTQRERKKFTGTEKEFKRFIKRKIDQKIPSLLTSLKKLMIKQLFALAKNTNRYDQTVIKSIAKKYKDPLTLLGPFIEFNQWIGSNFYSKYRKLYNNYNDHLKIEVLIEIHCRACQIASEIKMLCMNGYADGAMARWRSLHELCVTFLFLYDNSDEVIRMYLDYEVIENYDKMKRYESSLPKLGWRPISKRVRNDLETQRQQLIGKYGKDFAKSYGWTMKILPPGDRHIRGIENAVEQDHLRGIYSWASENVHAGVLGNKRRLGLSTKNSKKLLRGSSPDGIFDPVQFTTYTLVEMSGTLLKMEDSVLNKMYVDLLLDIQKIIVLDLRRSEKVSRKETKNLRDVWLRYKKKPPKKGALKQKPQATRTGGKSH